jgi:hypothetical protein
MLLPEQRPAYFKSAGGTEVVALDGNTFHDMSAAGLLDTRS